MDGDAPDVGFDEHAALFYGRSVDACPNDLVAMAWEDDVLTSTWLPPPGGCDQPPIPTGHAVQVHRADLGHLRKLQPVALPRPAAPRPSPVPSQPPADADAAMFDGHPVRPCSEAGDPTTAPAEVDGPLSDHPTVAYAQRGRAEMGFPSDQDTTRQRLADPADLERGLDFPLSDDEYEASGRQ